MLAHLMSMISRHSVSGIKRITAHIILSIGCAIAHPYLALANTDQCQAVFAQSSNIDRTIKDLARLRMKLDLDQAEGVANPYMAALRHDYERKEALLIETLETHKIMSRKELANRIRQEIEFQQEHDAKSIDVVQDDAEKRRREEEVILRSLPVDGRRAVFHKIEPGQFKMGRDLSRKVDVTISKPFEMMATQVTQIVWATVADLANTKLDGRFNIKRNPSKFIGDTRPVESMTYIQLQSWIEALNELSKNGEPALRDLIPGFKKGDVYRLPTEAEWEFVIRGRGQFEKTYHFGSHHSKLAEYAWYNKNSGYQTHSVALKKPLVIDGMEFFDMMGNVYEWVSDWYQDKLLGGVDPQGPSTGEQKSIRGGAFDSEEYKLESGVHAWRWSIDFYDKSLGFRLVKESAPAGS